MSRLYFYNLDALRILCALTVVLFHFSYYTPVAESLHHWAWWGFVGVQVFFVISGFVISFSLLEKSVPQFLYSRVMRLYPAAIVCGVISFFLLYVLPQNLNFYTLTIFAKSLTLYPSGRWVTSAYWTLPIELAFYSLVAVVAAVSQIKDKFKTIAFTLIAISFVYNIVYTLHLKGVIDFPQSELRYGMKNMLMLRHGHYFGLGMLLSLKFIRGETKSLPAVLAVVFFTSALEIAARSSEIIAAYEKKVGVVISDPVFEGFTPFVVFVLATLVFFFPLAQTLKDRPRIQTLLRYLGLATYPLYLTHESIGFVTYEGLLGASDLSDSLALMIAAIAFALVAAMLLATQIEKPIRRLMAAGLAWVLPKPWVARMTGR